MNKNLKKTISIILGILFLILLALVPTILIETTGESVKLGVNLKNKIENFNKQPAPIATIEPIEKEIFFHFRPGEKTYFLEALEQDRECASCQEKANRPLPVKIIPEIAASGAVIFSTTCSDSLATCLYAQKLAQAAKENKLSTTLSYDGCLSAETLKNIAPSFDAVKIEFGNLQNGYCQKTTETAMTAAMKNIKIVAGANKHLEVSYLLNSTNSGDEEINNFLTALQKNAGAKAIIHFSAALNETQPASINDLKRARDLAISAGFKYAYTGGINSPDTESTYCADGSIALARQNYFLIKNNLKDGACSDGTTIPGIWK